MRDVILYGHLRATFGHTFKLDVATPAEAIAALSANLRGFAQHLRKHSAPGYKILIGDKLMRGKDELHLYSQDAPIRIVPQVSGAKGAVQAVLGVVLVVAGMVLTAYGYGAIGTPMTKFGWAMVAGGVVNMLVGTPNATSSERPETAASYTFNGAVNTTAQGNPVAIAYGQVRVGSQVISAGISTDDMFISTNEGYSSTVTAPGGTGDAGAGDSSGGAYGAGFGYVDLSHPPDQPPPPDYTPEIWDPEESANDGWANTDTSNDGYGYDFDFDLDRYPYDQS